MIDRPSSLYLTVKDEIEELIVKGTFKPGDQLPSEYDLSKKYGVSRMTLREALRALEEEGLVAKKQGLGTFVKTTAQRIKSILDVNYGVTEMIKNMGFRPGTQEKNVEEVFADSHMGKALNVKEGTKIIALERVRTADKIPVAYTLDMIPATILANINDIKDLGESIYDFLQEKCNIVLSSSMAKLFSAKATRKLADKLKVKLNSPLFLLEQTDTDQAGRPVVFSREYFVNDYFDFVIFRRRKK
jgi:GntR family transcriptional regulator